MLVARLAGLALDTVTEPIKKIRRITHVKHGEILSGAWVHVLFAGRQG